MVGAATEKPIEPKQVRKQGTHSKLVSDERNVRVGVFKNVQCSRTVQIGRLSGVDGLVTLVGNAGNLEFDAQVNRKPVVMFEQSRAYEA